jgi:hypothetical protein
MVTVANVAYP